MNAHNEQHDSASPVVKQNLTTQPAAAQEAVDFFVCDACGHYYMEDGVTCDCFGGEKPTCALRHVRMAPVTAAPADHLHAHLLHMLGAKDHEDAGRIIGELHAAAMRTPAAPGIDMEAVRELLARRLWQWRTHIPTNPDAPSTRAILTYDPKCQGQGETDYNNDVGIWREACSVLDEALAMIDASPKGQPSSAECICGLDSPKGRSEAINQLLPPNAWPRWADRHVWDANGEGWFYGAIVEGGGEGLAWNYELQPSGIAMPSEHDWRVPVLRTRANSHGAGVSNGCS